MYLRTLWDSFPRELKTVLKSNIFNWFNEENEKIINKHYIYSDEGEPWYNHSYMMSDEELRRVFRIEYLSTVIGDASPWGGAEWTPLEDLSFLECFPHLRYLDISCVLKDSDKLFSTCPVMHKVETLRCTFNELDDLSFVLTKFPNLKSLNCSNNKISTIIPLFSYKLTHLYCADNPIPTKEIDSFRIMFPDCNLNEWQSGEVPFFNTFDINK